MTVQKKLDQFEESLRSVLQNYSSNRDIVDHLRPAFEALLQTEGLVPEELKRPKKEKYSQFLLYKPKDEAFSIVAFVWGPGQTAPIHDHLVWGLVGIYEGQVEETRYVKKRSDNEQESIQLEVLDTVNAKQHDISFVYPPNADIHSVRNPFDEPAITVHVYGADIGKQPRHLYENDSFLTKSIVTAHENEEALYSKSI